MKFECVFIKSECFPIPPPLKTSCLDNKNSPLTTSPPLSLIRKTTSHPLSETALKTPFLTHPNLEFKFNLLKHMTMREDVQLFSSTTSTPIPSCQLTTTLV